MSEDAGYEIADIVVANFDPRGTWKDIEEYLEKIPPGRPVMFTVEQVERLQHNLKAHKSWMTEVPLVGAYHGKPEECPSWYDGCNCTVENFEYQMDRIRELEKKLKDGRIDDNS